MSRAGCINPLKRAYMAHYAMKSNSRFDLQTYGLLSILSRCPVQMYYLHVHVKMCLFTLAFHIQTVSFGYG